MRKSRSLVILERSRRALAVVLLVGTLLPRYVASDMFNAQVELESLLDLRKTVSGVIEQYIEKEQMRLELVKQVFVSSGLNRLKNEGSSSSSKFPEISSASGSGEERGKTLEVKEPVKEELDARNPITAFLTIKGLSTELSEILKHSLDKSNIKDLTTQLASLTSSQKFPNEDDLRGAAMALTRLQDTYLLKTEVLAEGCLEEGLCSVPMTINDCFEVGKQSYHVRDYDHAIIWFETALRKLDEQKAGSSKDSNETALQDPLKIQTGEIHLQQLNALQEEIQSYLGWSLDIKNTLNVGKQFLAELTGIELDAFIEEVVKAAESQPTEGEAQDTYSTVMKKYDALCRGDGRDGPSRNPQLKCEYSTRNQEYFVLSPVKVEQVNIDPPIWIFHDVLLDSEIEVIQQIAKPLFKTATVVNSATGGHEKSTTRVSKSAWLIDDDSTVVAKVNRRIQLLTNLNLNSAEDLQIANYGIGGMYLPHFDFSHTKETIRFLRSDEGNRIATLMFYMSDVRMGGATVFPHINLSIWPEKGAAAFWYNLKPDGRGDYRTQHGACPVLMGSKWVSNKWFHERGQEFIRPCETQPNGPRKS